MQHRDTKFRLMQTVSAMLHPTFPPPPPPRCNSPFSSQTASSHSLISSCARSTTILCVCPTHYAHHLASGGDTTLTTSTANTSSSASRASVLAVDSMKAAFPSWTRSPSKSSRPKMMLITLFFWRYQSAQPTSQRAMPVFLVDPGRGERPPLGTHSRSAFFEPFGW